MKLDDNPARKTVPIVTSTADAPASEEGGDSELVSLYQAHKKIYPRSVSGLFSKWRWGLVFFTQIIFYGLPWLEWGQRQAVLFDLGARRFYIFGLVLYPQDFIYLTGIMVISALSLFLFTAVAGRQWCGYACPQTVYTEIFLWIEKKIEGDRSARMRLDGAPLSLSKFSRKAAKQVVWIAVALWTGFTFVGYFTPIKELAGLFATWGMGPWETFWVFFYGFATYGNAGFMREHMCKYICPYAQFQFVMFDRDTLNITYDRQRGEPRGPRRKTADPRAEGLGDCVDCSICVQVCPTGIDIRNGLQLECIGCAACIDACDQVMDKMEYPRGLIRYSTENAVEESLSRSEIIRRAARPRTLLYLAVFLAVSTATAWSLLSRVPLKVSVIRDRAVLSREAPDGSIENVFSLQLTNASEQARTYRVHVAGLPGLRLEEAHEIEAPPAGFGNTVLVLKVDPEAASAGAHPIQITVEDIADASVQKTEKASFWMP